MTCDLTMRSDSHLARFSMHRCRGPRPALQSRTQACRERGLEAGFNTGFVEGTAEHTGSSVLTTGCAGWHGVGSYRRAGARSTWEFPTTDMGWVPLHAPNPRTSLRRQWSRLLPGRALHDLAVHVGSATLRGTGRYSTINTVGIRTWASASILQAPSWPAGRHRAGLHGVAGA